MKSEESKLEAKKKVFLLPGEFQVSKQPTYISTLLGSCISVILFNSREKIGAMNHYMLPTAPEPGSKDPKYGDVSINLMINTLLRFDPKIGHLKAMLFGGAAVTESLSSTINVGDRNIEVARQILSEKNIFVDKEDVGGIHGRKLYYQTWDNQIQVNQIRKSEYNTHVAKKESHFKQNKVKVLVVDDSPLIQNIIKNGLNANDDLQVVGVASNAYEAREKLLSLEPDVITLDIIMPKMNGLHFLKKVMEFKPLPVVVVSSIAKKGSAICSQAKDVGAVDVLDKEELTLYSDPSRVTKLLGDRVRMAARVPVKKKIPLK